MALNKRWGKSGMYLEKMRSVKVKPGGCLRAVRKVRLAGGPVENELKTCIDLVFASFVGEIVPRINRE